jgi:hypothetical protein
VKQLRDTVWQRRGVSWIWDAEALSRVCKPAEVLSLRQFLRARSGWAEELPSNDANALVVGGLDGALDLVKPETAEQWLVDTLKVTILSFQAAYDGQAALIFWLPNGERRLRTNPASEEVMWLCSAPYAPRKLDFGRLLWGAPGMYPQEICPDGTAKPAGFFHQRIT